MPQKEEIPGEIQGEQYRKVRASTVLEGFPGIVLVSTIATGFLIDHLKCEQIGKYWFEQGQPTVAIHANKMIDPVGVYYNKKRTYYDPTKLPQILIWTLGE